MSNSASSSPRDGLPNIVFDLGTDRIRAGLAGTEIPTVDIPSVTGHAKHQGLVASVSGARSSFIGHDALQKRAILNLKYPIEKGVIHDWDDMERILQYTMTKELNVNPAEYGVLFSEPPLNPRDSRETLLHLMFESFQSPRVYLANSALLSLISVGRETGVVIHVGEQISHIVPIYEGYALNASTRTIPLGGSHLTNHLLTTLAKTHPLSVTSSSDHDIIRDIKEKKCYVATHYEREMKNMCEKKDEESYTLPDGRSITLSSERITIPEILFQPRLMGMSDTLGLPHLTQRVIESCDSSLHRIFYGAILTSGATCNFYGFNDRMISELNHLTPNKFNYITDDNHMTLSTYLGGSILASLQSFHSMWITQAEYLEQGDRIVHRKCF